MKKISSMLLLAAFTVGHASAQSASRDAAIEKIETMAFGQTEIFTPDSPLVAIWLTQAKAANPTVPQSTWDAIKPELASSLASAMSENGGPMHGVLRGELDSMSDAELQRVVIMLNDPAYRKFQSALVSPSLQRKVLAASAAKGFRMQAALNEMLEKHGLRQVH